MIPFQDWLQEFIDSNPPHVLRNWFFFVLLLFWIGVALIVGWLV